MPTTAKSYRARRADNPQAERGLHRAGAYESERFYTHRLSLLNRLIARTTKEMLAERFAISQIEWRILVQLEYRSPSKVAEIHARSLMQKPQISSALPLLIRGGYVVRQNDPADARAPWFAMTEEGLRLYREVICVSRERQRGLEALLNERERSGFESAVGLLIAFFVNGGHGDDLFGADARPAAATRSRRRIAK